MADRKPWQHKRASPSARGYDHQHRKLRALLLKTEPLCRMCKAKGRITAATIADHIVPLFKGGASTFDNYQPLCRECSDRKTLTDQGKRWRPRIWNDGWPCDD